MSKLWAVVVIVVAVVVAILAVSLPPQSLRVVSVITTFFYVMIPILGTGALVKFLACCKKSDCKTTSCDKP